ncbi:MAG TPA: hypothetical protein VFM43_06125 [Gaiellaceae bacterium]|nr:hypothetical protein [Gaiellaceae bacterium]
MAEVIYFPSGSRIGASAGLLLEIQVENEPHWFAAFPTVGPTAYSALFGAPADTDLFVIRRGLGYRLDTARKVAHSIEPVGIVGALMVPKHRLALFWNPICIAAQDERGRRWLTSRLSFDGLTVDGIDGDKVVGSAFDARDGSKPAFAVDLATGQVSGGAEGL